jgi:hypothetical protein
LRLCLQFSLPQATRFQQALCGKLSMWRNNRDGDSLRAVALRRQTADPAALLVMVFRVMRRTGMVAADVHVHDPAAFVATRLEPVAALPSEAPGIWDGFA